MTLRFPAQILLSIALFTPFAPAQTPATSHSPFAGSSEASISFGSSSIEGQDGNIHVNLGASYAYNWSEHFALLAEYNEQALGIASSPPATPTAASAATCLTSTSSCASSQLNGRSLQRYGGAFRYSFRNYKHEAKSPVTPYLIAGIGAFRASTASSSLSINTGPGNSFGPVTTQTVAYTNYSTGTAFGAYEDLGGGVSLYLRPHLGVRAEARLIHMTTASSANSSISTTTVLATGSSSGTPGLVALLGIGGVAVGPATNNDFRAAVSIFYSWGGIKNRQ